MVDISIRRGVASFLHYIPTLYIENKSGLWITNVILRVTFLLHCSSQSKYKGRPVIDRGTRHVMACEFFPLTC